MQARAADEFDRRCRAACLSLRVALTLPGTFVVENVLTRQIYAAKGHHFRPSRVIAPSATLVSGAERRAAGMSLRPAA